MLTKKQKIYLPFKRTIDIFGSLIGLVLLSPLLLVSAFLTKVTSKGPVFFKQERLGKDKKPFYLYKFRSMKVDALQVGQEGLSKEQQNDMTTLWGRFMRKMSIDEMPQLFNILFGQMSFIGPRPGMVVNSDDLIEARNSYVPSAYCVKPGLSGLSQIKLKRDSSPDGKARVDSYYAKHFSFSMDAELFFLSFLILFGYDGGR